MQSSSSSATTQLVEVFVAEPLDSTAVERLKSRLDEALAMRPAHLVVDLAECPFVDATAVQVLVQIHREAWQIGGRLTLRSPSPRLRGILRLSRVDRVLHITPEQEIG